MSSLTVITLSGLAVPRPVQGLAPAGRYSATDADDGSGVAREVTRPGELGEGLRRRWPLALLVMIPLFLGVIVYAESLPATYESRSVVSLTPRPQIDVGGDTLRIVLPKYVAFLSSRPTTSAVAGELALDAGDLRDGTDVSVAPETTNLEITVELTDSGDAQRAAAALAGAAVELSADDRLLQAEILVPAVEVTTAVGPPRRLLEAGGLLLALLAGITLALIVDRSQPKVSTPEDLADLTGQRVLGTLPRSRVLRQPPVEALGDPGVSASVGAMLVQLDSESRIQAVEVLAVTSPSPGDGKTTVAAVLATGLARLDARVLCIDADLRRPRLGDHLGLAPSKLGFSEVLEDPTKLDAALVRQPSGNLFVLTARPHGDASNLLARRLQGVLAVAREKFDIVVLDCPPVLATDDSLVITTMCDATLVVVDRGSRSDQVAAATTSLQGIGVRVVGCVLNRAAAGIGGSRAYGSYARR